MVVDCCLPIVGTSRSKAASAYTTKGNDMKPLKPFMGTTQVPNDILSALAKRKLTISEIRVVMAVCKNTIETPGEAMVTIADLAKTMRTRKERASTLLQHAKNKNILSVGTSGIGPGTRTFVVNAPSTWNVPG